MDEEKIVIRIKNGNVNIATQGIKGQSCKDITKNLENALGIISSEKLTDEYYEENNNQSNDEFQTT